MKSVLTLVALLTMTATFAPSARAQDSGRWETRVVTETTPGHWETRSKQVWQEPWVEVESRKTADGTVEHVKVEHPGRWKTVTERVWVEPTTKKVEKKVWVAAASEYSKPWDDTPRTATGRTEQPTRELPSTRTEQPTAPRTLPAPTERPTSDPFTLEQRAVEQRTSFVPTPARQAVVSSPDPLVYQTPTPPPAPAEPRVVYVREPAPAPRVVYVNDNCWSRPTYYDPCGPRVRVGVGVGVRVGVGVGFRVGHRGGVGFRIGF